MIKLLLCLFSALFLAVIVQQLRQQRLEVEHETTALHDQITSQQAKLWNQQLQIAVYTAPNAIARTVESRHMKMVPEVALPGRGNWTEQEHGDNDAE